MAVDRKVTVYGAGAVGGYLGGLLALASTSTERAVTDIGSVGATGDPLGVGGPPGPPNPTGVSNPNHHPIVTLLARPRVADAIMANGLTVRDIDRDRIAHPTVVSSAVGLRPSDLVVLAVRAYDVLPSVPEISSLVGEHGLILALQNGVGTEEELATALGRDRVITGALTVSVVMEEPGVITRTGTGGGIALATMDGSAVPTWIVDALAATGLPTVVVDEYRSVRWSKLLLNMLGAATSAILDLDLADIVAHPGLFRLEQLAFREACRVMDRRGISTIDLPGYTVRMARLVMRLPRPIAQRLIGPRLVKARSGRSPGTRADIKRGKTEIGWYNGAVADAAEIAGIRAPVNRALATIAVDLSRNPEARDAFRGKPDALVAYVDARNVGLRL